MRKVFEIEPRESTVFLTSDIVYGYRIEFCNAQYIPLKLSIMKPRYYFPYDTKQVLPTIVFLCGGAWVENDKNVWLPELAWFAKRGYAVASIQYAVTAKSRFPDNILNVKQGIRFLRSHSEEFGIDTDRIILMGESAGGYLTSLCAATNNTRDFDKGDNLDQSSQITAAVAFYPPAEPGDILRGKVEPTAGNPTPAVPPQFDMPADTFLYPSVVDYISKDTVPMLLLHGLADDLVDPSNSERIYKALQNAGVCSELFLVKDAGHADYRFIQPEMKEQILAFMDEIIRK